MIKYGVFSVFVGSEYVNMGSSGKKGVKGLGNNDINWKMFLNIIEEVWK